MPLPLVEPLPVSLSAYEAFRRLARLRRAIFFDSARRHASLGRYSFVAADPYDFVLLPPGGQPAFEALRERMPDEPAETLADLPPFQGGVAGLCGYDLNRQLERLPAPRYDEFRVPAFAVGLYDVILAFDHARGSGWIISHGQPAHGLQARSARAAARMKWFQDVLSRPATPSARIAVDLLPATQLAPQYSVSGDGKLTSNFTRDDYLRAVERAVEYIHAGDIFQVNLAQRLLHPAAADSLVLYDKLRTLNPGTFAGYFDLGEHQVLSASPERFFQVLHGEVEARPIKGTRARTARPEADLFAGDDLRLSEKDRAENVMIVDLLRNDLSRACLADSVQVSQLCGLEVYEHVQHLVSVIRGRLRADRQPLDLLRDAFPGGSITGAPKPRAMEIIAELEPTARGAYCGSLFYLGFNGAFDANILIRTITAGRGWWQAPVGGGIVAMSHPRQEYEETWHKAEGLLRAIQAAEAEAGSWESGARSQEPGD